MWTSDRRLWLTDDRAHVVEDGDPEARYLLVGGAGMEIPKEDAERYGLAGDKAVLKDDAKPEASDEMQDKAVRGPKDAPRRGNAAE